LTNENHQNIAVYTGTRYKHSGRLRPNLGPNW